MSKRVLVCGVDEAGRGPLAGPVAAAAVVLGGNRIAGLDDSKKLGAERRAELAAAVREECLAYATGLSDVGEIDRYNIRQATVFAMQRAVHGIMVCPDIVLVDGNFTPDFPYRAECVVGGDGKVEEIMAASILAKVYRDGLMSELDARYPQYGFIRHKGYGTAEHLRALEEYGACPAHRRSFGPVGRVLGV